MKKAYLLVYNDSVGTREEIRNYIDEIDEVHTWRYDLPNMFYLISTYSAEEISIKIREKATKGRFIISEVTENSYGWLRTDAWYLIQNKEHKPKSPSK